MNSLPQIKQGKSLDVTKKTLRTWAEEGKIEYSQPRAWRRYNVSKFLGKNKPVKINYIYGRVSTHAQKGDLERQVEFLLSGREDYKVIKDIGSGLNFKRKGLQTLLDSASKGELGEVVVTHRDRLSRFAFELLEDVFSRTSGAKIVVLNDDRESREQELVGDIISIITVFSSRIYGLRRNKKKIEELLSETADTSKNSESEVVA